MSSDGARHLKPVRPKWLEDMEPATPEPATDEAPRPATATPGPGTDLVPVPARPLTLSQKAAVNVAHWAQRSQQTGGLVDSIIGDPVSLRRHIRYTKDREWLPDGHPGGFIGPAGQVQGFTIGLLLVAAGNALTWMGHKSLHFWSVVVFGGLAALFLWLFIIPLVAHIF